MVGTVSSNVVSQRLSHKRAHEVSFQEGLKDISRRLTYHLFISQKAAENEYLLFLSVREAESLFSPTSVSPKAYALIPAEYRTSQGYVLCVSLPI